MFSISRHRFNLLGSFCDFELCVFPQENSFRAYAVFRSLAFWMVGQGHKMQYQEHCCRYLLQSNGRTLRFMFSWAGKHVIAFAASAYNSSYIIYASLILVNLWFCCFVRLTNSLGETICSNVASFWSRPGAIMRAVFSVPILDWFQHMHWQY